MHDDTPVGDTLPRKRRKGIYVLPNLFTLAALFGGFYAIVMAMNARFDLAALGVFGTGAGWPDIAVAAIMAVLGLSSACDVMRQARLEMRARAPLALS